MSQPLLRTPSALTALASLLLLTVPCHAFPQTKPRTTVCNGFSEFCSKSYGNITFVGAHDSYAYGTSPAANQDYNVTQQLDDGIRMLQIQSHSFLDEIYLCHTSCFLYDGGTLQDYLTLVKSWLDANPTEVITILAVNSDDLPPTDFSAVYQAVGLDSLSYSPMSASLTLAQWPTLGDMIDEGTRVVTFLDAGADFSSVPYIIDEFSNMWETAYDVTNLPFDCAVNRTHGTPADQLMTINHFLDIDIELFGQNILVPDKPALYSTNAASGSGSLGEQASTCISDYGMSPNFMLVDFYEYGSGSVFEVAAGLNGVTYAPATPIAPVPS